MDIQDKYNAVAKAAQQLLREEEDKTIFDTDAEVYAPDDDEEWEESAEWEESES